MVRAHNITTTVHDQFVTIITISSLFRAREILETHKNEVFN